MEQKEVGEASVLAQELLNSLTPPYFHTVPIVGMLHGLNRELICNQHQEIACRVEVASIVDT